MFTCETDDGIPAWKINGTVLNDLPPEIHDDIEVLVTNTAEGTTVEELIIPDIVGHNGTRAQCLVVDIFGGSTAESETVTMRIQGISRMHNTMHCWLVMLCIHVLQIFSGRLVSFGCRMNLYLGELPSHCHCNSRL